MKQPNLILIMTDQHRGDCLGCDGNPILETPMLDELARCGTRFRHAYTACPSCAPAHASLLTGMSQWRTGILGMGRGQGEMANDYLYTLPGELAAAGYHTQGIGKMHFHPQRALNGFHNTILDESLRVQSPGFRSDYMSWFEEHKRESWGNTRRDDLKRESSLKNTREKVGGLSITAFNGTPGYRVLRICRNICTRRIGRRSRAFNG